MPTRDREDCEEEEKRDVFKSGFFEASASLPRPVVTTKDRILEPACSCPIDIHHASFNNLPALLSQFAIVKGIDARQEMAFNLARVN